MLNIEKTLASLEKRLLFQQEKTSEIKEHIEILRKAQTQMPLK